MKPSELAMLQELSKCYGLKADDATSVLFILAIEDDLTEYGKKWLRRLWHLYQPQIRAMRRNRERN